MAVAETDRLGLARRLRDARRRAGLSQQDVAGPLGVARSAVSDIERGRRRVGALELASFAKATGTDVDLLLDTRAGPVEQRLRALPGWHDLDDADRRSVELHAAFLVWRRRRLPPAEW
ncbi:helix-turn-helix domain-containing protein [Streptomyces sp. NPDC101455]|uniref:helix-turn-helix domain-containing protein n=1 Tax=Streptomyces sp. NPDC101455 TaxID=3366142 RepID=UPI00381D5DAD